MVHGQIRRLGRWLTMVGVCLCGIGNASDGADTVGDDVVACAIDGIGVWEPWGKNRGPEVDAYNRLVGAALGSPWCASSCAMDHYLSGSDYPVSAYSPSWFPLKECIYYRGKKQGKDWQPGDCAGFYFAKMKRIAHIEIIESADDKWVRCIGGNTSDDAGTEVNREGGVKCRKKRLRSSVHAVSRWWDN